jgi:hypothetical protein
MSVEKVAQKGLKIQLFRRWSVAVGASLVAFVLVWLICAELTALDTDGSIGVAGMAAVIILTITAWWAPSRVKKPDEPRESPESTSSNQRIGIQAVRGKLDIDRVRIRKQDIGIQGIDSELNIKNPDIE